VLARRVSPDRKPVERAAAFVRGSPRCPADQILSLQRTIGNAAVARMLTRDGPHRPAPPRRRDRGLQRAPKRAPTLKPEPGERDEAIKGKLSLVEKVPRREWLITGFPIGGSEISESEARGFVAAIVRSLQQGQMIYATGQDPLEVLGYSDAFGGEHYDNDNLRKNRARHFCEAAEAYFGESTKSYKNLLSSCEAAPAGDYVEQNTTRAGRAQNRSILIRRAAPKPQPTGTAQPTSYDAKYGPSEEHCRAYTSAEVRTLLGPVYANNAHCSCMITPDDPINNCVRDCLQKKMWQLIASALADRRRDDPPLDLTLACAQIWKHHRDCYAGCGCTHSFVDFPAFDAVCNIALPCAADSAAINVLNRCMPPKKDDVYQPVK
jgi:hypothetical protein